MGSGVPGPRSQDPGLESCALGPGSWILDPGSRVLGPGSPVLILDYALNDDKKSEKIYKEILKVELKKENNNDNIGSF